MQMTNPSTQKMSSEYNIYNSIEAGISTTRDVEAESL